VETLIETTAFELLPQLPCAKADPGRVEGGLVEAIEVK
jgi:hypothetical protein